MAEAQGEGFCTQSCDIDEYIDAVQEMGVMEQVADLEPVPDEQHDKRTQALRMTLGYQMEVVDEARRSACQRPCEGYSELGTKMGGLLTGMTIHCPVILRQFASSAE